MKNKAPLFVDFRSLPAKIFFLISTIVLVGPAAFAQVCTQWSEPQEQGRIGSVVNESSGMVNSLKYPDRLYHINDSGSGGEFYISDLTGHITKKVNVGGFRPFDTEDMDMGPCPAGSCVFIADIGDNIRFRSTVTIAILVDTETFSDKIKPLKLLKLRYGDRKRHDAESFMVHPNGDVFIITKEYSDSSKKALPSKVFKITSEEIWSAKNSTKTVTEIGSIDFPAIFGKTDGDDALPTASQIHASGNRFMVLTYSNAIEFYLDLALGLPTIRPEMYSVVPLIQLRQQESMTYSWLEDAFYYSTESNDAMLMKVQCLKREP